MLVEKGQKDVDDSPKEVPAKKSYTNLGNKGNESKEYKCHLCDKTDHSVTQDHFGIRLSIMLHVRCSQINLLKRGSSY